jgi:hypothetical protein
MTGEWNDEGLRVAYEALADVSDTIDNLMDWAEGEGYRATQHKLQEAWAPVQSAMAAIEQYDDGRLERRE